VRPRGAWLYAREETPAQRALRAPLTLASGLYGAGARLHRAAYRRGWLRARRLSCTVVSVGNLTAGGSGKTPLAAWLAHGLRQRGYKVALASRGYGGRGRARVQVVSDGHRVQAAVSEAGDEPLLLAAHAPGVPVLVGADRSVVGLRAISLFGADVLVLDDGFQHHRLSRDVDVVVMDGRLGFGNGRLLPRGPLREPLAALAHAHAVGVVDGPLPAADARRLEVVAPEARRFRARRRPVGVRPLRGGAPEPVETLRGVDVGIVAGIARPDSLRATLTEAGARVVAERAFPDHHRYTARDLEGLTAATPVWVTTEKDAVKILPAWVGDADVRVLVIDLAVEEGGAFLDWVEGRLR